MLCELNPGLARLYWLLEGAARTLKEQGVSGLAGKIKKHLGKGEGQ